MSSAAPDFMTLVEVRRQRVSEPDEGQRLQERRIKELTAGEPVEVKPIPTGVARLFRRFRRQLQAAILRVRAPGLPKGETGTAGPDGRAFPLLRRTRKGRVQ